MSLYREDSLLDWAAHVLQSTGVPADDALQAARVLVRSDARGYGTHGLSRMPSYVDRLTAGEFKPRPDIRFEKRGATWRVEADNALGQVAAHRVVTAALPFLASNPMLWVNVRKVGHLGALGVLALEAAEAGMVCFMGQRTPPLLAMPGFSKAAIGHNPFAFACPAGANAPLVVDMACSVAARGHILAAARDGKPIPADWALDVDGEPTTDAVAAASGFLQPSGGHKGMGLAMMIECFAAALGADMEAPSEAAMAMPLTGAVPGESAFFFFINPGALGKQRAFLNYMEHWINHYLASGGGNARIPGQRAAESEAAKRESGIEIPASLEMQLRSLGDRVGVAFPPAAALAAS